MVGSGVSGVGRGASGGCGCGAGARRATEGSRGRRGVRRGAGAWAPTSVAGIARQTIKMPTAISSVLALVWSPWLRHPGGR